MRGVLEEQEVRDAVFVAQRHGTTVAAEWLGVSPSHMGKLRHDHDPTFKRGRGHPTREEMERAKPNPFCSCARCKGHRRTEKIKREQALHARRFVALSDKPVWQNDANCRGMNPELWFPARGRPTGELKAICATCTVREECLAHGLHEKFGIWGGKSERERRVIRRVRRRESGVAS